MICIVTASRTRPTAHWISIIRRTKEPKVLGIPGTHGRPKAPQVQKASQKKKRKAGPDPHKIDYKVDENIAEEEAKLYHLPATRQPSTAMATNEIPLGSATVSVLDCVHSSCCYECNRWYHFTRCGIFIVNPDSPHKYDIFKQSKGTCCFSQHASDRRKQADQPIRYSGSMPHMLGDDCVTGT